jgi:hypothetical protein
MEMHHYSYRKYEYTKMINSTTITCQTTPNVYMFLYVIFNVSLLKNTASIFPYFISSNTLMISSIGSVPIEILSSSDFKPILSK